MSYPVRGPMFFMGIDGKAKAAIRRHDASELQYLVTEAV